MSDNKNLWKIYTDLEDETPLVAVRCRDDGVRDLEDPVEGGVCADGHVSPAEVIVNGPDHSQDVEVRVFVRNILSDGAV